MIKKEDGRNVREKGKKRIVLKEYRENWRRSKRERREVNVKKRERKKTKNE